MFAFGTRQPVFYIFSNPLHFSEKAPIFRGIQTSLYLPQNCPQSSQKASEMSLRPILMTTVVTVAGQFPLTLVTETGAEARKSIGPVGGMAIGTLFTLLFLPSIYMLIAKDRSGKTGIEIAQAPTCAMN